MHIKNKLKSLLKNTGDMALKRRAGIIIEELDLHGGEKIIDVGCGDGYYLYLLSNLGLKLNLTGVDFDKKALESARKNLKGKKVRLVHGNLMSKLPFADSFFDKAVMSEVVEHLPNDVKGLKEAKRILKKNGTLVITVPNANYPFLWDPVNWLLEKLFSTHIKSGFWAGIWNQHLRLYKPREIKKVIQGVSLKVMKLQSLTFWSLPFNHYFINLGARILAQPKKIKLMTCGANKFSTMTKKSPLVQLFFYLSTQVDRLNDFWVPKEIGVSLFVKATKK